MKASLKTTISIKIYFQRTTWKSCPSCHYSSFTQMLRSHLSRPQGQSPRPGPGQWCPAWRPHCPHPLQSRQLKMFMGTLLFSQKMLWLNQTEFEPILSNLIQSYPIWSDRFRSIDSLSLITPILRSTASSFVIIDPMECSILSTFLSRLKEI